MLYRCLKYSCCFLLTFFFLPQADAQISFTGKVINEENDVPLQNAAVYFNNTTVGAVTNQQGEFTFEQINFLNTDLVISCKGYELMLFKPAAAQLAAGKKFIFKIHPRSAEIQNKLSPGSEVKKRWLKIFYKNVLGISAAADKTTISNEGSIYFVPGANKTSFIAYADTSLQIINTLLGYKINFNLVEFWYDEATGHCDFLGYAWYNEMGDAKKYEKNRRHFFYGSSLHFYRSLIANHLTQQGFGIFIEEPFSDSLIEEQSKRAGALLLPEEQRKIVAVTAQQILFIDSTNNFSINVTGRLLVQYYRRPFAKKFIVQQNFTKGMLQNFVETFISFKSATPIVINSAGVVSDLSGVSYDGYWMYERLANTLPYDYHSE